MTDMNHECEAALTALQSRLDSDAAPLAPEVRQHLIACDSCRLRFAAAKLMMRAYPPAPRTGAAERIAIAVESDRRWQTTRRWLTVSASAALAAAVVLAVSLRVAMQPVPTSQPELVQDDPTPRPRLQDRLAQAKSTVAAWAPSTPAIEVPDHLLDPSDALVTAWQPAAATLADAGKGLTSGFEPITGSAMRAVSMLRRDLPNQE